jgi:hypothetical protein
LWRNNHWFFHHDNAPARASLLIHDFLTNMDINVLPQPPYSPYLVMADFYCFPNWNPLWKDDSRRFKRLLKIRRQSCARSWKRRITTVCRSGNGTGISASVQEGSTLKVIRLILLQASPKKIE